MSVRTLVQAFLGAGAAVALIGCLGHASDPGQATPDLGNAVAIDGGVAIISNPDGSLPTPKMVGNMLCEANFTITGTFTPGAARPADVGPGGCWPDGTWTFTLSAPTDNNCADALKTETQYTFKVTRDTDYNDTIVYQNDPTNMYVSAKIGGNEGGALCLAAFMVFSADGKLVTNLRPALQTDNATIAGAADYRVWDTDQRD